MIWTGKIFRHAYLDPPVVLQDGDVVENAEFLQGGSGYGRIIFKKREPMILCEAGKISIEDSTFSGDL
jgi:hypothetical protein